jgi:hypothetical protein
MMRGYDATEIAYKNGYVKGYEEATKEILKKIKDDIEENKYNATDVDFARICNAFAQHCLRVLDQIAKDMEKDLKNK